MAKRNADTDRITYERQYARDKSKSVAEGYQKASDVKITYADGTTKVVPKSKFLKRRAYRYRKS